jgi:hypothetical protein
MIKKNITRLFVWQYLKGSEVYSNKLILKSMNSDKERRDDDREYDCNENAKSLAILLEEFLPGNTNDILYDEIAKLIKQCYKSNPELLNQDFHIQNLIRCAISNIKGE